MTKKPSGLPVLDYEHPNANMYGCLPCPECGSKFRWPTQVRHPTDPGMILCDYCGYKEKYDTDQSR